MVSSMALTLCSPHPAHLNLPPVHNYQQWILPLSMQDYSLPDTVTGPETTTKTIVFNCQSLLAKKSSMILIILILLQLLKPGLTLLF